MGLKYNSFAIRGIDTSNNNGIVDWSKFDVNFSIHRVGYGRTIDDKFPINWAASKGRNNRSPYWYIDYYSNWYQIPGSTFVSSARGLTDEQWGTEQANNCWASIKDDPEGIVWADVENGGPSYSPPLTDATAKNHALKILRAFLSRMDELNKRQNGIYCSLGLLSWFDSWFRDRPLWVAWYPYRSVDGLDSSDVIYAVKKQGWKVAPLIWQYASDGDVDDNGTSDGKTYFKTELKEMDLNGWVGTVKQYESMFSTSVPDPIETPDDEVIVTPPANTRVIEVKTATRTLTLRKKPQVSWLTQIRTYPAGTKFDCLEKVTVNGNIWQRVGIDQYIADTYDGIQYLK